MLYDVFICHASEDKDDFVRPLAEALRDQHMEVWYDEFALELGDSLSRAIDRGLARSRYGVVVLSPSFFAKEWPQRELAGLVARQTSGRGKIILPVWHDVTRDDVCEHSPPLADQLAVSSAEGVPSVVRHIAAVVRPRGSPLVIARDRLIEFGLAPPVITDEWWLDVVEASNREPTGGFVSVQEHWGRWTFPLPVGDSPSARGDRLAWTAMQLAWGPAADTKRITQITEPETVLEFVRSYPGLAEACHAHPAYLASYAPQLTIPGLGGEFEGLFADLLQDSVSRRQGSAARDSGAGSSLTTTGEPPCCDELVALRHPSFGGYQPAQLACQFVQGELFGPEVRFYETIDYLCWLLSDESEWMPPRVRRVLLAGMAEWGAWPWSGGPSGTERALGLRPYPEMGALMKAIQEAQAYDELRLTEACVQDVVGRFEFAAELLDLRTPADTLVERFIEGEFIRDYYGSGHADAGEG